MKKLSNFLCIILSATMLLSLLQVFTYVKNMDSKMTGNVSGMLLYAKTAETELEPCEYSIGGNKFYVRTLDLDRDFKEIAQQLEDVAGLIKGI